MLPDFPSNDSGVCTSRLHDFETVCTWSCWSLPTLPYHLTMSVVLHLAHKPPGRTPKRRRQITGRRRTTLTPWQTATAWQSAPPFVAGRVASPPSCTVYRPPSPPATPGPPPEAVTMAGCVQPCLPDSLSHADSTVVGPTPIRGVRRRQTLYWRPRPSRHPRPDTCCPAAKDRRPHSMVEVCQLSVGGPSRLQV